MSNILLFVKHYIEKGVILHQKKKRRGYKYGRMEQSKINIFIEKCQVKEKQDTFQIKSNSKQVSIIKIALLKLKKKYKLEMKKCTDLDKHKKKEK